MIRKIIRKSEKRNKKRRKKHGFWNMSRAARGSVTLLLALLLLPMITFSTMIIDASRLQSVRTNIAGAGELTLNAMMSEYNVLLEDMYGLFANCKNMDDLKPALQAYFQQSAESFLPSGTLAGNDYAQNMIKQATNLVLNSNGDISQESLTNFLNVALTGDQFRAEAVQGGALANPNVMKQQIIEYMKYRGPVSLASTLLGKLNFLNNASTQTDACDKKVQYTQSLGELKNPCTECFKAIEEKYNMGALVMNFAIQDGFEGDVTKICKYFSGSTENIGLDEIIARSKQAYERATMFYMLNGKSPFREKKLTYDEIRQAAQTSQSDLVKPYTGYQYDSLLLQVPEDATAEEKVQIYHTILNNIGAEYERLIHMDGTTGSYEASYDQIAVNQEPAYRKDKAPVHQKRQIITDDDGNEIAVEYVYNAEVESGFTVNATRSGNNADEKKPTYQSVHEDGGYKGCWPLLFDMYKGTVSADDSLEQQQLEYSMSMLDLQNEIASGYYNEGIMEYAVMKDHINHLSSMYQEYSDKLLDLRTDYFKETVRKDVIEDEANKDLKEDELVEQMEEKWLPLSRSEFGDYAMKAAEYNACSKAMSENEQEIRNFLDDVNDNQKFFLNFAQQYNEEGYSTIFTLGQTLEMMQEGLNEASEKLGEIQGIMNTIADAQKNWKTAIDGVDSDSTKAAMLNDYQTSIDKLNREEVDALKNLIDNTLKKEVSDQLKMVKTVKYLGQQLYNVQNVKTQADQEIVSQIKDKVHNKLLQMVLTKVSVKANDKVWERIDHEIDHGDMLPVFPEYKNDSTILSAQFDPKNLDNIRNKAREIVLAHYEDKGFVIKNFHRHKILDGIDDAKASCYDADDMGAAKTLDIKDKNKNLLDPNEAFVITLYTEYEASQKAKTEDQAKKTEGTNKQGQLEDAANKGRDDANKGESSTTAAPQPQQQQTSVTTVKEEFGTIMGEIEGYCDQNEKNNERSAPDIPNSSINKDDPASSSGGSGLNNANSGLLDQLKNLGSVILQNVYLEEYLTEMFTCRTDNQNLNKLTATPDKDVLPVVLLNGYCNANAKKSYNNNANASAGTGRRINENTAWYGKEIEYLLIGNSDLNKNMLAVDGTIFAIRFALNAIYAFTAPDIQSFALEVATAIAGWTVIGVPIVQACITILIALAESGYDIYLLHDGQNVAIYKNATTFVCSPSGFLKEVMEKTATKLIDKVTDYAVDKAEEMLDQKINEIQTDVKQFAQNKVSDYAGQLESTVHQYADQQKKALRSAIANLFVSPILNSVMPSASLLMASDRYGTAKPDDIVKDAIADAMETIRKNLDASNGSDSAAKRIARKIMENKTVRTQIINETSKAISDYIAYQNGKSTDSRTLEKRLTALFLGDTEQLHTTTQDKDKSTTITGLISEFEEDVNSEITKMEDTINENIAGAVDKTAANVKDFVHEQFEDAANQLSGKAKDAAKNLTSKLPNGKSGSGMDTGAASGGFSLNYKEYLKILMLIWIAADENQILQRAAVLVTANMRHPYPDNPLIKGNAADANSGFDIRNANTLFSVTAEIKMKTLFPWTVEDNQGTGNPDTGIKLDFSDLGENSIKIKYCGINGY